MSCNTGFSGKTVTARCTDVNTWSENSPYCTSKMFIIVIFKPVIVDGKYWTQYSNQSNM